VNSEDLQPALRLLPHGAEFRFIDRLTDLNPGQSGSGEYTVCGDEPFLRGQCFGTLADRKRDHIPQRPYRRHEIRPILHRIDQV